MSNERNYWSPEVEEKAITLLQSKNMATKNKIYLEIRPAVLKMIEGLLQKRSMYKDYDMHLVDIETHIWKVLVSDSIDPNKGKVYSFLTRCVWNCITLAWKKQFQIKNMAESIHSEEFYFQIASVDSPLREKHMEILQEIENSLGFLIPYTFPKRTGEFNNLYTTMKCMIDLMRNEDFRRIKHFKMRVLELTPNSNMNQIGKLINVLKSEYRRLIKTDQFKD